ncbi:alpha/beta hydrolase [uncultured Deinococcus sp.]|uniref:alpha/beta hydrolase family protein n=1 Tax=uncultured Deinococcus sp. TaxID=158789 RepID=UPI002589AE42|nr:alpha/beta hydrolase [uncultured Deinococcus sp.]
MRRLLPLMFSLALGTAHAADVAARTLTLDLGGVPSRAELLLPPGAAPAPLVLLIQGTGPEDRDGSYAVPGGVVQGSLGALARRLAAQGFAVMRYDKRYAAQSFDPATAQAAQAGYAALSMRDLLADARTALDVARRQPGVAAGPVFVYGWSEGSVVAASLAQEVGARGLIVQGPVVDGFAETFADQFAATGLAYLTPYAQNGRIDLKGVLAALGGPGSPLAKSQAALLLDRDSTPQQPKLAGILDTDGDGRLDLRAEVAPRIVEFYRLLMAASPLYAPATSLPPLGELASRLRMPVLILQGENDGNVNARYAIQLDAALRATGNTQVTLKLYPGLGHSLGSAADITRDVFAPMAAPPMNDMAAWMKAQLRR